MKKRVFSYDKWNADPEVKKFIEVMGDDGFRESMKQYDGMPVKMINRRVGKIGDFVCVSEWLEETQATPFWLDALMVAVGLFAIYGLAVFGKNLAGLLCSMM